MRNLFLMLAVALMLAACHDDTDFTVLEDRCGGFDIETRDGGSIWILNRDTAWWVYHQPDTRENAKPLCMADRHKISAFFNVLRDIQVMGLSSKDPGSRDCDSHISIRDFSGRCTKELRFSAVPGSSQMTGKVNNGKYYIVGVPGLNQSPIEDFSSAVEYWKDRQLLYVGEDNVSAISVENMIDPSQSFAIVGNAGVFEVHRADAAKVDAAQQKIRQYLGSIVGIYRAASYLESASLDDSDMIYRLKVSNLLGAEEEIAFYRKCLPDGQPDFNQMYFRKGTDVGTAKYYDFDKVLVDLDKLK